MLSGWLQRLCAAVLLTLPALVQAHAMPESLVWLDSREAGLEMTVALPLNRLEMAFGQTLTTQVPSIEQRYGRQLQDYVLERIAIRSAAGSWTPRVLTAHIQGTDAAAEWVMQLQWASPGGESTRTFDLTMNTIVDQVKTHQIQVLLRTDWDGGQVNVEPRLLGVIRNPNEAVHVDLGKPQLAASALQLVRSGLWHVWEGADHLLFLLLLLIVCTQQAENGRWKATPVHWKKAWIQAVGVITAFTLGHSATLVVSHLQWLQIRASVVEVCVAWTIVITALHSLRPLWPRAHVGIAAVFGCVHGMAFSSGLSSVGLTGTQLAAALLSFNIGIELAQLLVLVSVFPAWVYLAARVGVLRSLSSLLAMLAIACGMVWVVDRSGYSLLAQNPWLDLQASWLYALPPLLWVSVLIVYGKRQLSSRSLQA